MPSTSETSEIPQLTMHLLLIFLAFILRPSITDANSPITNASDLISSCLNSMSVANFTMSTSPAYSSLLDFSIQNLRFIDRSISKPTVVILPATKDQLRSAVMCCRNASLTIRIRSGGHSYEGQSYVADKNRPFAVIDLMNLNRVQIDVQSKTAWIEAGATIGETYYSIANSSRVLAFSAGTGPTVGVGGHIAGGGFGFLSRKYGISADLVIDAVLVNSEGRVLDRKSMGEEVFWALRGGGGGSWGAVYAWKVRLVPVPSNITAFQASRSDSVTRAADLVHKWQFVAPKLPDDFHISANVGPGQVGVNRTDLSLLFNGLYLGPKSEAVAIMSREFPELNLTESACHEFSWIESAVLFSELREGSTVEDLRDRAWHTKSFFKAKSDYVRTPISKQDLQGAFDMLSKQPKLIMILKPYGGAMSRITSTALPFPHREGNLYNIQYYLHWNEEDEQKGDEYLKFLDDFYTHMGSFVSKDPRAAYVNYIDLDIGSSQSKNNSVEAARIWGEKYFLANFDRLVRAKTAIDPNDVFQNAQSIPPRVY